KCTDVFRGGIGLGHALTRPLQHARHRSPGPSLTAGCVVPRVGGTTARSDSLCVALDFGCGLIRGLASAAHRLTVGRSRVSPVAWRPSSHAVPSTPERSRAAPESVARAAAFAQLPQARPARPLTGSAFDAAGFIAITACEFVPPPLAAGLSTDDRDFTTGLLWRFARTGLSPAGRPDLAGRYGNSRLWTPMRALGGPALRRHPSSDGILLAPPLPSPRRPDRCAIAHLPRLSIRTSETGD